MTLRNFRFFLSWKRISAGILIAAVAVRIDLWRALCASPLRFFDRVPGLDMQTLLLRGEWGGAGTPLLTVHRLIVALFWYGNGFEHRPMQLAALQMAAGALTAWMAGWCMLHLFRNRPLALAAGILCALYAPLLLYECVMLQETFVTFTGFLSFTAVLWARRRHFAPPRGILCGAALALAAVGRPTALLWSLAALVWIAFYTRGKRRPKRIAGVTAAWFAVLLAVSAFNWYGDRYAGPFFRPEQYAIERNLGSGADAAPGSALGTTARNLCRVAGKAAGRVPLLFSVREIPENLNYYFLREHFPPLAFLPGPALLIPLALGGTLLALPRWRRREGLPLAYIALLALPLCAIYPVGRYRLMLIPVFTLTACYLFLPRPRRGIAMAAAAAAVGFLLNTTQFGTVSRATDYVAWALALEQPAGEPNAESIRFFHEAFLRSGGKHEPATVNLLIRLLNMNAFNAAEALAAEALAAGTPSPALIRYYLALSRLGQGRFEEAQKELEAVDPDRIAPLRMKYHFFLGEALRRQGKHKEALAAYARALSSPDVGNFRVIVEQARRTLQP